MGQPIESADLASASPDVQSNVEAFVGAAIDAYKAYEAYVSPPNTEAPSHDSASAHIPSLRLVDEALEGAGAGRTAGAKLAVDKTVIKPEAMNSLPTPLEKVGTGGAQGRAQQANQPESLSGEELDIVRDAVGLDDGQFDPAATGQHLADDLYQLEKQGGWPALKARVHDMNRVLEATGSRYELQVQTVGGKGGDSQRSLAIIDSTTGEVTASMPFNRPQLKPDKPQEPLRK